MSIKKLVINGNEYPMRLEVDGNRKIVSLRKTVIETAGGIDHEDEADPFEGKVLTFRSVDTPSKKGGYADRAFVPKELQEFVNDPVNVALPKTIKVISISRPLNIDKLNEGSVKGQMVLGFKSHVEKSVGDDKVRTFFMSYDFDAPIDVTSFEEDEMQVGEIAYELE